MEEGNQRKEGRKEDDDEGKIERERERERERDTHTHIQGKKNRFEPVLKGLKGLKGVGVGVGVV